ncbi:hypothetical protein N2152v2_004045 [Parachlorella kessleri]
MAAIRNKVLVLNAGSSSLKFKLFEMGGSDSLKAIASGLCERIGDPSKSSMKAKGGASDNKVFQEPMKDHTNALQLVSKFLSDTFSHSFVDEVHSVGHRVVHGRELSDSMLITPDVRKVIEQASDLAPLHNPPNLQGIDAALKTFPESPQVAVFDTAFHATMPPDAYMYALPYELYVERAIRRYGFHGTSYKYLTQKAAQILGKPENETNLVICHLGAGSSMCAVQNGKSIDTTMGLTPLEGLVMGSRCGDIDPAIIPYLVEHGMSIKEVDTMLNKKSGFLGLTGAVDLRHSLEGREKGDERAKLGIDVFVRRVRKYLGAYLVHLGGKVDAVVFSAGIGENSAIMRELMTRELEWAGLKIDADKNKAAVQVEADIATPDSKVKCLVIPTDEELSIAQQTLEVVRAAGKGAARV